MNIGNVEILSKVYLENTNETWSAAPNTTLLHKLRSHGDSKRMICAITTQYGVVRIALGDPVHDNERTSMLYLPPWFCNHIGVIGDGDDVPLEVRVERCEDLPCATSLTCEVLGNLPPDFQLRDVLEEPLSQLGVVQEGMVVPIPCFEGHADLFVKGCKPAACVFLDGTDIEFIVEEEQPQEDRSRIPTPMPTPMFASTAELMNVPMFPALESRTLASGPRAAFSGIGRRLNEM